MREEGYWAVVAKAAALLFLAAVVQVAIAAPIEVAGGAPDVLLVTLVAVAFVRGSIFGAVAGFAAGFVLDVATLETLGVSSLLLTQVGYWVGRYGETTGRDRRYAPFLSVGVATALYAVGGFVLHFLLGEQPSAEQILVRGLLPTVVLNVALAPLVVAASRRLLQPGERFERPGRVRLVG